MEITSDILAKVAPGTPKALRDRFLPDLNRVLPMYDITTELRVAAFLTTVCFESDYFKALKEYASGWAYDISRNPKKARELGNTEKGDGPKYKGAGGIEITGKKNYQMLTDKIGVRDGVDFVENPELVATVPYFVETACVFWDENNFNKLADKGKCQAIQNLTNRGDAKKPAKNLASRLKIYHNVLDILPDDFTLSAASTIATLPPVVTPPSVATETTPPPTTSTTTVTDTLTSVNDKLSSVNTVSQTIESTVSSTSSAGTRIMTGAKMFLGIGSLIVGFVENNWEWLLLAALFAILAAYIWNNSRTRHDG